MPKQRIRSSRAGMVCFKFDKKRMTSSAYKAIWWLIFPIYMPVISACCRIAIANGSIAIVNSNGLKGHPCRFPRCNLKGLETIPLVKISACGLVYRRRTHWTKLPLIPNLSKTLNIYVHSIRSNAFSASSERIAWSGMFDFSWTIFNVLLTLWKPYLPLINPFWSGCTIFVRIFSNFVARILERIFTS